MKTSVCMIVCLVLNFINTQTTESRSVNGGTNCAVCVVLVALVEQMVEINNATVVHTGEKLCSFLPVQHRDACDAAFKFLEPLLVEMLVQRAGPDVACHALKFCRTDPGQETCRSLTPSFQIKTVCAAHSAHMENTPLNTTEQIYGVEKLKGLQFEEHVQKTQLLISHLLQKIPLTKRFCDLPGIKVMCHWVERFINSHEPVIDIDGDGFSAFETFRGAYWRGKDCSDLAADFHPGALSKDGDRKYDSNCNGIFGVNNQTQSTYEDELCGLSQARGVAVLGDSIAANFHFPSQWIDATQISKKAFAHANMIFANELDWPMMSTVTGYGTNNWTEAITGFVDSIYLHLRERNHCNHRDYQNIAVNGARSSSEKRLVHSLSRFAGRDKPIVVFSTFVGNDVCNGHVDTFAHMTTPAEFYNNTLDTLETLHKNLPKGSHVFLIGLADGRALFDNMAKRIHPIGTYWGTFTYVNFYDYLNCLQISPCRGWMNSNHTVRDITSERANKLSEVLREIASHRRESYSNFKLYYMDNPFKEVSDLWRKSGRQVWELIDASDGFHSNQLAAALTARLMWDNIQTHYPDVLGPVNPHNGLIKHLFGDQGGY